MSDFEKAVYLIRNGPPRDEAGIPQKLQFYSLFKQATEGDVQGSQPWAVNFEARAKWDAWKKLEGMSADEAKSQYVKLVADGDANWLNHSALKTFK
jgi:diazepam-binding inhibitor (GABA receptor modulating acyl-CoA-binding protein)